MTFTPRLVALDIDGTLVDREGHLPDPVRDAVGRVRDAGVPVVLATGRGLFGATPVHEALGLPSGDLVVSNGAVTARTQPLAVVSQVTFDPAPVIRQVLDLHPRALVAVEDVGAGFRLNRLFPDGELNGRMTIESVDELMSRPAHESMSVSLYPSPMARTSRGSMPRCRHRSARAEALVTPRGAMSSQADHPTK